MNKRYLIINYKNEKIDVKYPLPLNYINDPNLLKINVDNLKNEIQKLKSTRNSFISQKQNSELIKSNSISEELIEENELLKRQLMNLERSMKLEDNISLDHISKSRKINEIDKFKTVSN